MKITREEIKQAKESNEVMTRLIKENKNLTFTAIKKYLGKFHEDDDLWQEANIAFIKSVHKYDLNSKYEPYNYIFNGIMNHINSFVRSNTGIVQIPYECFIAHDLSGKGFSVEEISAKLDKTHDTIRTYLNTKLKKMSIETTLDRFTNKDLDKSYEDKELYRKLTGTSAENVYMRYAKDENVKDKIYSLFDSELDYNIFSFSLVNKVRLIEAYRVFIKESEDKQNRPVGYPAYNARINKIKKTIKESINMGYVF